MAAGAGEEERAQKEKRCGRGGGESPKGEEEESPKGEEEERAHKEKRCRRGGGGESPKGEEEEVRAQKE